MRGVLTLVVVVAASAQYPSQVRSSGSGVFLKPASELHYPPPPQGMFEHIQPSLNEQGNNPYPGCLPTPNGDPSCTGPIPLWHQGGKDA